MSERGEAIVLIGFSGAGKSSVGRALETLTSMPRYDTDEMICAACDMSIAQIFRRHGEEFFRDAETDALRKIPHSRAIIVTGGGIILRDENVAILRRLGRVVHLTADEETLFARVAAEPMRPLLSTADPRQTLTQLLRKRLAIYRAVADHVIDTTNFTPHEAAALILRKWDQPS